MEGSCYFFTMEDIIGSRLEKKKRIITTNGSNYYISTAAGFKDSKYVYLTASLSEGVVTVIEEYNTLEEARKGHRKWKEYMGTNLNRDLNDVDSFKYKWGSVMTRLKKLINKE